MGCRHSQVLVPETAQATPAMPTTPSRGEASTNIWASVEDHSQYVIFHDALMKVKDNIENGTLALSYDIAAADGTGGDNRGVLLALPGKISLCPFHGEKEFTYGVVNEFGISFNVELVTASQRYYAKRRKFKNVEEALNDLQGFSYSAIFQETFEHELAHLMNHCERMNDEAFDKRTPPGLHLFGEPGFAVQRDIRRANGDTEPRILEVHPRCMNDNWNPPLGLKLCRFRFKPEGTLGLHQPDDEDCVLRLKQLHAHLRYKPVRPKQTAGDGSLVVENSDEALLENGQRPSGWRPRSSPVTVPSTSSDSSSPSVDVDQENRAVDSSTGSNKHKAKVAPEDDDEEEQCQFFLESGGKFFLECDKAMEIADVNVQFCDFNRQPRTSFTASDEIFVKLTFTNPPSSATDVYVRTYCRRFGRDGVSMSMEGQQDLSRYVPCDSRYAYAMVKVAPGESHTFFRKFCGGICYPSGNATEDQLSACWTPSKPGTYNAKVSGWEKKFPFKIIPSWQAKLIYFWVNSK